MMKKLIEALSVLTGTIIGVGLFGLPYITSRVGLWVMLFYFFLLGWVIILLTWLYGEIASRTKELHRLPGYAKKYLGAWAEKIAFVSNALGACGSILAYIIIGGGFLYYFLNPFFGGNVSLYIFVYFAFGAVLILLGIKSIARTEVIFLALLVAILGFAFLKGFPLINVDNLFVFDKLQLFLPYGAVLFALSGVSMAPEIKEILSGEEKAFKKVVFWSVLLSAVIYLIFIVLVLGVCGQNVSEDAIGGLRNILGNSVVKFMFLFGILTTFTSYIAIGINTKKMLCYDLKFNRYLAWAAVCFIPLLLYFLGLGNFIAVISLTGGVFMAMDVILIILVYLKAKKAGELKPAFSVRLPNFLVISLILFFILGAIYEIVYFLR